MIYVFIHYTQKGRFHIFKTTDYHIQWFWYSFFTSLISETVVAESLFFISSKCILFFYPSCFQSNCPQYPSQLHTGSEKWIEAKSCFLLSFWLTLLSAIPLITSPHTNQVSYCFSLHQESHPLHIFLYIIIIPLNAVLI